MLGDFLAKRLQKTTCTEKPDGEDYGQLRVTLYTEILSKSYAIVHVFCKMNLQISGFPLIVSHIHGCLADYSHMYRFFPRV